MSKEKTIPLGKIVNDARVKTRQSVQAIAQENNIPSYIMDGIICEILADIRKQEMMYFYASVTPGTEAEDNE